METARVEKIAAAHHQIYTDIEIDAPAHVVWAVLTDVKSYGEWAAFLVAIDGQITHGSEVTARFQLNPTREKFNDIKHTISVEDGVEFFWAEKGPAGICDNHHFRVEELGAQKSRFIQSDALTKGLTWLLGGKLSGMYAKGYVAFNQGLKNEAERRFRAT